jgi:hypothetical protein
MFSVFRRPSSVARLQGLARDQRLSTGLSHSPTWCKDHLTAWPRRLATRSSYCPCSVSRRDCPGVATTPSS